MDSTLIENEVIDEIAKFIGVEKQVSVGFTGNQLIGSY
jgi:phosphoserine phosphatase